MSETQAKENTTVVEEQIVTLKEEMPSDYPEKPVEKPEVKTEIKEKQEDTKTETKTETKPTEETPSPANQVYEKLAKSWGWRGKGKFKGRDEDFINAETFVENERKISLTAQLKNQRLSADVTHIKGTMGRVLEQQDKLIEIRIKEATAKLEKEKITAIQESDVNTVEEIDKQLGGLAKEERDLKESPAPEASNPYFEEWQGENDWYGKDDKLTKIADDMGNRIAETDGLGGDALLNAISIRMKPYLTEVTIETEVIPKVETSEHKHSPVSEGVRISTQEDVIPSYDSLSRETKDVIDNFRDIQGDKFDEKKYIKELKETGVI